MVGYKWSRGPASPFSSKVVILLIFLNSDLRDCTFCECFKCFLNFSGD